jgi:hypothetical protein
MFSVPRDASRWGVESGNGLRQRDKVEEKKERREEKKSRLEWLATTAQRQAPECGGMVLRFAIHGRRRDEGFR